jgi:hypothetical protein
MTGCYQISRYGLARLLENDRESEKGPGTVRPQRDHPISRTRSNGSCLASHALTGRGGCQDAIHDELNGDDEIRNHALGSAFRVNAEILLQAGLQASLL